jgi:hypothetical protein
MRYKEKKKGYYGIQNKRSSESEKEGKTQQNLKQVPRGYRL